MTTIRARLPDVTVRLHCMLGQLSFPENEGCPLDINDTHLLVRRAGGCEDDWLVAYMPFQRTTDGEIQFRLDAAIHDLPPGYYDGVVMEGCEPCGLVRFDKTKQPSLDMKRMSTIAFTECPPPGGLLHVDGITDMLDPYVLFKTELSCALSASATVLIVDQEFPKLEPGVTVELVVRDGIAQETVVVTGAIDGRLIIERNGSPKAFPKGSCVQFEWTANNVRAVANEDCPTPDASGGSTTGEGGGTDSKSATLTVGKGLVLATDENGNVAISLAESGVPAGEYGGITVDACGRVVSIDAEFPANALPILDGCCKKDE